MTFVRHVKFNFSIIVSLESITVNETKECFKIYYMQRAGAKNSKEDRIPVEQVFHRGPALFVLSPRAYICTVLL